MRAYNLARNLAREGRIDGRRLNRALGVAQRREPSPYVTTLEACSCPDFQYRRRPCKHMYAVMLRAAADRGGRQL